MPLNWYVTLGRSGLRVSPFCLGTMTFGDDYGGGSGASVKDSETMLSHYLEQGGNFLDTANGYTRGHSEKIIGDFFQQGKGKRDRAVIATKKAKSGVLSTIIGARTLEQLGANLTAVDFTLAPEYIASLDSVSKPVLNFPADFAALAPSVAHAGATVNGVPSQMLSLSSEGRQFPVVI